MKYREVQPFVRNKLLTAFLVPLLLLIFGLGYGLVRQVIFNQEFGAKPVSNLFLTLIFVALTLLLLAFLRLQLVTQVSKESLVVEFKPLGIVRRQIPLNEIESATIASYNGIADHGGWGWRISGSVIAFTVYGNQAVKITTWGNKRILIGTQHPHDLLAAVRNFPSQLESETQGDQPNKV